MRQSHLTFAQFSYWDPGFPRWGLNFGLELLEVTHDYHHQRQVVFVFGQRVLNIKFCKSLDMYVDNVVHAHTSIDAHSNGYKIDKIDP